MLQSAHKNSGGFYEKNNMGDRVSCFAGCCKIL